MDRLVLFETSGSAPGRGWCLEPHDLAASKLAAGREKDYEFVGALVDADLIDIETLSVRIDLLPRSRVLPAFLRKAQTWVTMRAANGAAR